jgi:hypothetical protein
MSGSQLCMSYGPQATLNSAISVNILVRMRMHLVENVGLLTVHYPVEWWVGVIQIIIIMRSLDFKLWHLNIVISNQWLLMIYIIRLIELLIHLVEISLHADLLWRCVPMHVEPNI